MSDLLEMKEISKSFARNLVLEKVNFSVRAGEVHALLGENGAGKSTLVKILGGIYQADAGKIFIQGKETRMNTAMDALRTGVSIIHQEIMMMPHLSIAENIFMGRELRTKFGTVDIGAEEKKTREYLTSFGLSFAPSTRLKNLTIAEQQIVEIIRAASFHAKIIAMDEPTSSLSEKETERLFRLIRSLREKQVGVILISHRLGDIFALADRISVLRDGVNTGTVLTGETNEDELIRMMVGRDIEQYYATPGKGASAEVVLSVEHLSDGRRVKDASFVLHKGEILGVSGLVGAGRSEMAQCIFGLRRRQAGTVTLHGKEVRFASPAQAIAHGVGYVCEDRKKEGLFLKQDVRFNTGINVLEQFLKGLVYNRRKENELVQTYARRMQTKITGIDQVAGTLSGGNQQKVLISRWLACTEDILLLDEPTRGVDVKTKQDIYGLIGELTKRGMSIVFISSELTELIHVCDTMMVMSDGMTTGTLERADFDEEAIMQLATKEFRKRA